jgi:endo-1,4-beta-xylanase
MGVPCHLALPAAARRRVLTGLLVGLAGVVSAFGPAGPAVAEDDGVRARADAAGVFFGAAVDAAALETDEAYRQAIIANANTLSTVDEFDVAVVQPQPGVFDFTRADAIVDFADANGMTVRGHGLISGEGLPDWIVNGTWTAETLTQVLRGQVTAVVSRYAERNPGVVTQWDVVDEAFLPDGSPRDTIWRQVIGDDYLRIAFEAARAADPDALLFYDDFYDDLSVTQDAVASGVPIVPGATLERSSCDEVPKCVGVRDAISALVAAGVPIDGVGLQARLLSPDPFDVTEFTAWVEELGLRWAITEFDVPVPVTEVANPETLTFQADAYRSTLQACVDAPGCDTFVSWGVTDRVSSAPADTDGAFGGALFLDANGAPKPAYDAITEVLTAAAPTTVPPTTSGDDAATLGAPTTERTEAAGDDPADDSSTVTAVIVGVGALVVLAAVVVLARRRRRPDSV